MGGILFNTVQSGNMPAESRRLVLSCKLGSGRQAPPGRMGSFSLIADFSLIALLLGGSNKGKELIGLSAFLTIPHSRGESDNKELEHVCVCPYQDPHRWGRRPGSHLDSPLIS